MNRTVVTAESAPGQRNIAGRISLGFGIATVLANIAASLASSMLPLFMHRRGLGSEAVLSSLASFTIVQCVLALAALVAGLVGLLAQDGQPRVAAGAGTALGAGTLATAFASVVGPVVMAMLS